MIHCNFILTYTTRHYPDQKTTRFHLIKLSLTCCVDQMTQLWLKSRIRYINRINFIQVTDSTRWITLSYSRKRVSKNNSNNEELCKSYFKKKVKMSTACRIVSINTSFISFIIWIGKRAHEYEAMHLWMDDEIMTIDYYATPRVHLNSFDSIWIYFLWMGGL